jgi:hypothetical protein
LFFTGVPLKKHYSLLEEIVQVDEGYLYFCEVGILWCEWWFPSVLAKDPPTRHYGLRTERNHHFNRVLEENVHRNKDALGKGG